MPTNVPTAGKCPKCGGSIPRYQILIEYEIAPGRTEVFAECPSCEHVSHPE